MSQISASDQLFATLSLRGDIVARIHTSAIDSVDSLVRMLRACAPGVSGMTKLSVRNSTQGWSAQRAIFIR